MAWIAPRLVGRIPIAALANPPALVELFAETIVEELDFRLEAQNMLDVARVLREAKQTIIVVPRPHPTLVRPGILVMERLEGFGYEVIGINYFSPQGEGTRLKVTADVTIDPKKFKVPRMLFNRVFPHIEGLVKKAVQPNLTALARGLRSYYAAME